MIHYKIGQRWISDTEPDLGLGLILKTEHKTVTVYYPMAQTTRIYASHNAPLKRIQFKIGDQIPIKNQATQKIIDIKNRDDLLIYQTAIGDFSESEIDDQMTWNTPIDSIKHHRWGELSDFFIRLQTHQYWHQYYTQMPVGFLGARMDLIPHQLYVADTATQRIFPRILLSDEVGLGKTIEACLILHKLIRTHQCQSALIIVPEALMIQWWIELRRRFNLSFKMFDIDIANDSFDKNKNPFEIESFWIIPMNLMNDNLKICTTSLAIQWDLVILDEAHHIEWHPDKISHTYQWVEQLSQQTKGMILVSAISDKMDKSSHFGRLQLLDAHRFNNYPDFIKEQKQFEIVSELIQTLESKTNNQQTILKKIKEMGMTPPQHKLSSLELKKYFLDIYGPSRVIFKNTRRHIKNFPKRLLKAQQINAPEILPDWIQEFQSDHDPDTNLKNFSYLDNDPRIQWIINWIKGNPTKKLIIICHTFEKLKAIQESILKKYQTSIALFHEHQSLIQRDRQSAWFSELEGPSIMICSEIGAEGRNFQFTNEIFCFDLPLNPEIIEQRIGRLDRIGQHKDIFIHTLILKNSPQEWVHQFLHSSLNSFERCFPGSSHLMNHLIQKFISCLSEHFHQNKNCEPKLNHILHRAKQYQQFVEKDFKQGRYNLIEEQSFQPKRAKEILKQIAQVDQTSLQEYLIQLLDHFGISYEAFDKDIYLLKPDNLFMDILPDFPEEGLTITFNREIAKVQENLTLMSWDHPLVLSAMEFLKSESNGVTAISILPSNHNEMIWEWVYILEATSQNKELQYYFPPYPIRIFSTLQGNIHPNSSSFENLLPQLRPAPPALIQSISAIIQEHVETAQELVRSHAQTIATEYQESLHQKIHHIFQNEINRMKDLKTKNDSSYLELDTYTQHAHHILNWINESRLRLDQLHLIIQKKQ